MTVQTFRKRPIEIQAVQWTGDNEAERTPWIETGRVHEWLYALSESERPTPTTPPHGAPQRHAGGPGPVEPGNETARGYEAPQGAAESCGHCGLPIAEGARGTAYGIALHHTGTNPPQADPIDCYRLVTVYGEPIGARIIAPEDEGIATADVLAQIAADEATERVPPYHAMRREQHPRGGER